MTVPVREALGSITQVRKWWIDVNTGTYASPTWVGIFGREEFKPALDPSSTDTTDFEGDGWKSEQVTELGWSIEMKLHRKSRASDVTAYDPGQEFLRLKAAMTGLANRVDVRFYEMEAYGTTPIGPRVEAYRGYASVKWSPDGGKQSDPDKVSCTLTGMGKRTAITHPSPTA